MNTVFLLLGSNLGNRKQHLSEALTLISRQIGRIGKASSVYETAAWGDIMQPDYLNQVVQVHTLLAPQELLKATLLIEKNMGRVRKKVWESRLIDIDILFYNQQTVQEDHLQIPHPHLQDRRFVMVPLAEIAPDLVHPVLHLSVQELLVRCPDPLEVKKYACPVNE